MNKENSRQTPERRRDNSNNLTLKRMGATALVLFTIAVGVAVDSYANRAPQFSDTKTEYVAEPGDSTWIAAEHVKGIDKVDIRRVVDEIQADPANAETFKDNVLQPGETIVIPESVKR